MWFSLFILCSIIILFLSFYVRWLLQQLEQANVNMSEINIMMSNFAEHLTSIHEMEMFYGDQTLKSLMDHARAIIDQVESTDLILNTPLVEEEQSEDAG